MRTAGAVRNIDFIFLSSFFEQVHINVLVLCTIRQILSVFNECVLIYCRKHYLCVLNYLSLAVARNDLSEIYLQKKKNKEKINTRAKSSTDPAFKLFQCLGKTKNVVLEVVVRRKEILENIISC